jgi:adenine C2-methylase RlmN of 23S rRNA A2503 and tRNA A37
MPLRPSIRYLSLFAIMPTSRRMSSDINYVLFDGVNDTAEYALKLAELIDGDPRLRLKFSDYNPAWQQEGSRAWPWLS